MKLSKKTWTRSSLNSWDSLFPLGVIALFFLVAIPIALGAFDFGLGDKGVERFQVIYTDIGVQTTAGIFAIVISLSLVTIQFAAQEYSHRIMEYYIRSVIFWSTLVVYLGTIVFAMVLQATSSGVESPRLVALVVLLSVLAIALLVPHFLVTASYLKPEFIIGKLLRRIDPLYAAGLTVGDHGRVDVAPSNDRLLPVVEITERSIDRGDLTTTRSALDRITGIHSDLSGDTGNSALDVYVADHLSRIGRKAASQPDKDEAAAGTIAALQRLAARGAAIASVERIDALGFLALRVGAEGAVEQMIRSLNSIGLESPETRGRVLDSYFALVGRLASGGYDRLLVLLAECVVDLSSQIADDDELGRCLDCLEAIGHDSAENGLIRVVLRVAIQMRDCAIGRVSSNPGQAAGTILRMLRVEQAINPAERQTIAVVGFARSEVDQATRGASDHPGDERKSQAATPGDFSDLWTEDKD